jgi:DNA polymerase III epsilon subunit-like protein
MSLRAAFRVAQGTVAFIDFETMGLSPDNGDRLIEVGVVLQESHQMAPASGKLHKC